MALVQSAGGIYDKGQWHRSEVVNSRAWESVRLSWLSCSLNETGGTPSKSQPRNQIGGLRMSLYLSISSV